jgi:predicted ester cyclase
VALRGLSDLEARFEPVLSDGSRIAAHATIAASHAGEFLGVAATGKRVSWGDVHVHAFDVRNASMLRTTTGFRSPATRTWSRATTRQPSGSGRQTTTYNTVR